MKQAVMKLTFMKLDEWLEFRQDQRRVRLG